MNTFDPAEGNPSAVQPEPGRRHGADGAGGAPRRLGRNRTGAPGVLRHQWSGQAAQVSRGL